MPRPPIARSPAFAGVLALTGLLAFTGTLVAGCGSSGTPLPGASPSQPSRFASGEATPSGPANPTAGSAPSGPVNNPPLSSTDLPTLRPPTAPPRDPTDQLPTDVIVGTITAGGSGPCYGLETNDGKQYALYSEAGTTLNRGATVRVWYKPATANCGPGIPVSVVKVEIVR